MCAEDPGFDKWLNEWLQQLPLGLLCLDFDEVGKKKYAFWLKQYPHLRPWPAPCCKSPGDAFAKSDVNMTDWVKSGLLGSK
jgi:hypothetical protein